MAERHPATSFCSIGLLIALATLTTAAAAAAGFRDLNRSGVREPYEDPNLPVAARVADLLARMTLEEKAGAMMHATAPGIAGPARPDADYDFGALGNLVLKQHITSFVTRMSLPARRFAGQSNLLQGLAARGRLGIPVTLSTDPRNHFGATEGASVEASGFSQWPDPLGLAATGDARLVREFADTVRQEYRAVGLHMALAPQADLATEPRWPRIDGTFGEDPALASALVREYVVGLQHGERGVDARGVAAVVKHWVGYGAAQSGFDGHNIYGRFSAFTGHFEDHVRPFVAAFSVQAAAVMPTYNILLGVNLDGRPVEAVGAGFNTQLLTRLLRGQHGFAGLIVSDWLITNDCDVSCQTGVPVQRGASVGMPWGVESLPRAERFAKGIDAGLDQFGGVTETQLLVEAVRSGRLSEERLDESVARVLEIKFRLGLFENPYVDVELAARIVGRRAFQKAARAAQRRSLVLLENHAGVLPIAKSVRKVFARGVAPQALQACGLRAVTDPAQADIAILRVGAPHESLHPGYFFGSRQHEGSLAFAPGGADATLIAATSRIVPTVVVVRLDRPAILTPIKDEARAIVAEFGASDAALLDVLTGRAQPQGRLPLELPSSMEEVLQQAQDAPHDTRGPLYPIFFGRRY